MAQFSLLASLLAFTAPARQWAANAFLSGVHLNTNLSFGEHSITLQNDKIKFSAAGTPVADGEVIYDPATHQIKYHDGAAVRTVPRADEVLALSGGTMTGTLNMNSQAISNLPAPAGNGNPATKSYVDSQVAGLSGITYVNYDGYIGNRTVAQIDALSPAAGWTVVATDSGTPSAGTSDALTAGDVAQYDGSAWKKRISAVGGFVPNNTRLVSLKGALFAPLTDAQDENKFGLFDGTSNTPTLTSPVDGASYMVRGEQAINEGAFLAFDLGSSTVDLGTWANYGGPGLDHSLLANLAAGDGHTQYAILAGRGAGQTFRGGANASANLILGSTGNATKGNVQLGETGDTVQLGVAMSVTGDVEIKPATTNQGVLGTSANKFKEVHAGLIVQEDGVFTGNGKQYRLQETDYGFRLLDQTGTGATIQDRTTGTPYRMLRVPENLGLARRVALRALGVC